MTSRHSECGAQIAPELASGWGIGNCPENYGIRFAQAECICPNSGFTGATIRKQCACQRQLQSNNCVHQSLKLKACRHMMASKRSGAWLHNNCPTNLMFPNIFVLYFICSAQPGHRHKRAAQQTPKQSPLSPQHRCNPTRSLSCYSLPVAASAPRGLPLLTSTRSIMPCMGASRHSRRVRMCLTLLSQPRMGYASERR